MILMGHHTYGFVDEISDILAEMGNTDSISAISRAIKTRMLSRKQYSEKKPTLI